MDKQIFIATHKAYAFPNQPAYTPIWAGSALGGGSGGILRDDTGDHISPLNKSFCELTVLYWMWKNCRADIQGLVHYRRYFTHPQADGNIRHMEHAVLDSSKLHELMPSENDIILPKPQGFGKERRFLLRMRRTVYRQYRLCHIEDDWHLLERIVKQQHPQYAAALEQVKNAVEISCFNMFIAHQSFVNAYCTWLFDILFALQQHIDLTGRDTYQQRVFGFLSERLLNVYVLHHQKQLNIKYLETTFLE